VVVTVSKTECPRQPLWLYGLVWNGKGSSNEFFFLSVFRNLLGKAGIYAFRPFGELEALQVPACDDRGRCTLCEPCREW
jgi:hypothetical protein